MRVLALVPARGGSRRIPRKNLARLGGRTLVRRALETACAAERIEVVCLSSDDEEVLAEAEGLERATALRRPARLSTDTALAYDVTVHALESMEADHGRFDALALLQATSPFTSPEDVDGALALLERSGAASVVTVAPVEGVAHPAKLKRMEGDRLLPLLEEDRLTPSHALPEVWARNGSVYASRRETIERGLLVDDADVLGYRMPPERSHDIDTPLDLEFAEFLLARQAAEAPEGR